MGGGQKEPKRSISDSEGGHGAGSRLRVMFRSSTADVPKFDEDMGPEVNTNRTSSKSKRAAKALAELNKGDDKLTRKSEEQIAKVGI